MLKWSIFYRAGPSRAEPVGFYLIVVGVKVLEFGRLAEGSDGAFNGGCGACLNERFVHGKDQRS